MHPSRAAHCRGGFPDHPDRTEPKPMSWTDERVETLKTMWSDGKSASQIAKELGGVTRNAVIGKVHRLGLSNRSPGGAPGEASAETPPVKDMPRPRAVETDPEPEVTPESAAAEPEQPEARPLPVRDIPPPGPVPGPRNRIPGQPLPPQPAGAEISPETLASLQEVAKKSKKLTLMQLTERTCKWPVGDPATDDFWFCGLPAAPGKPYCDTHVSVAFQPMSTRRDRRSGSR